MPELLITAINAALEAGSAILEIYHEPAVEVELKDDKSPLTKADRASHEIIARHLAETNIPVLSEEDARTHDFASRSKWTSCWIVDPLDGTKEFIRRNGEFTVNIALAENGVPVLGVIFIPVKQMLYYAEKDYGAFKTPTANCELPPEFALRPARLPLQTPPQTFTIVGSRSHSSPETEAYVKEKEKTHGKVDFIAAGSSLKFCHVAEGLAHAYPRFAPTMEWDIAAGHIIVQEAGGKIYEWPSKNEIRYNRENLRNPWFLAEAKK